MAIHRVVVVADAVHAVYRARLAEVLAAEDVGIVGPETRCVRIEELAEVAAAMLGEHEPEVGCFGFSPAVDGELVPMNQYESGLLRAAETMRRWCGRQVVFVNSPPVDPARYRDGAGRSDRDAGEGRSRSIIQSNQLAGALMGQFNIAVADLHRELDRERDRTLADDGRSLTPVGIEIAAAAAAKGVFGVLHP